MAILQITVLDSAKLEAIVGQTLELATSFEEPTILEATISMVVLDVFIGTGNMTISGRNILSVDASYGSDQRGQLGFFPFRTITAAKAAAASGDTIVIFPGTYNEYNLAKDGVTMHFLPNAKVRYTGSVAGACIFSDNNVATEFYVTGKGQFWNMGTGGSNDCVRTQAIGTKFYIECDELYAATNRAVANYESLVEVTARRIQANDGAIDSVGMSNGNAVTRIKAGSITSFNNYVLEFDGGAVEVEADELVAEHEDFAAITTSSGTGSMRVRAKRIIAAGYGVEALGDGLVYLEGVNFQTGEANFAEGRNHNVFVDTCTNGVNFGPLTGDTSQINSIPSFASLEEALAGEEDSKPIAPDVFKPAVIQLIAENTPPGVDFASLEEALAGEQSSKAIAPDVFLPATLDLSKAVEVTVAEFSTKINTSELIAGRWYLLTDFRHYDFIRQTSPVEYVLGNTEQIMVMADSANSFNKVGYSVTYKGEVVSIRARNLTYSFNYSDGVPSGQVIVSIVDSTHLSLTDNGNVLPCFFTRNNFNLNVYDNDTGTFFEYNSSNYGTHWTVDESGAVTLLITTFTNNEEKYIEYSLNDGNTGDQEIEITGPATLRLVGPITSLENQPDFYLEITDNVNGYFLSLNSSNKGLVWSEASGIITIAKPYNSIQDSVYYEDGNAGGYTISILSASTFKIDNPNIELLIVEGVFFELFWYDDEYSLELSPDNYGSKWMYANGIITIIDDHDLTDFDNSGGYLAGSIYCIDLNSPIDIEDDVYMYGEELYELVTRSIDLLNNTQISGTVTVLAPAISRRIDTRFNDIQCDTRTARFRRYKPTVADWSSGTAYTPGNVVYYEEKLWMCLRPSTAVNPSESNDYWQLIIAFSPYSGYHQFFLGRDPVTWSGPNPYTIGTVTSVSLAQGGTGYPPSTTIVLEVAGGNGKLRVNAVTNSSGVVTSVSIYTVGANYTSSGTQYLTFYTQGSGCGVTVYSSNPSTVFTLTPDLSQYRDFWFWGDSNNPTNNQNNNTVRIEVNDENQPIDFCTRTVNQAFFGNSIKLLSTSHCVLMDYAKDCNMVITQFAVGKNLTRVNASNVQVAFLSSVSNVFTTGIANCCLNYVSYSIIGSITYSFAQYLQYSTIGKCQYFYGRVNNSSLLLVDIVTGYFDKCNILTIERTVMSAELSGLNTRSSYNNNYGMIKDVYVAENHYGNSGGFVVFTTIVNNFYGNTFFGIGSYDAATMSAAYHLTAYDFYGNSIPSYIYQSSGRRLRLYHNTSNGPVTSIIAYHSSEFVAISNNIFFGGVQSLSISGSVSIDNNKFFGLFTSNTFGSTGYRNILSNVFLGRVQNNTFTQGTIQNNTFLGDFGGPSGGNTFNRSGVNIESSVIGPNFRGNSFTSNGQLNTCTIGDTFQSNNLTAVQTKLNTESTVTGCTFSNATTRLTIKGNTTSGTIPALTGVIYGDMEVTGSLKGAYKSTDGSSGISQTIIFQDFSELTHTLIFKNGILTSYSTS
jgi:hypothetical protein